MVISRIFKKTINWKLGALGGIFSAAIAFYVNINSGPQAASVPALKQLLYGILIGGSLAKLAQRISVSLPRKWLSIFLATVIPTLITVILITSIHLFKGTPNPFDTVLFTTLPTPIGFLFVATFKRNKSDKSQ